MAHRDITQLQGYIYGDFFTSMRLDLSLREPGAYSGQAPSEEVALAEIVAIKRTPTSGPVTVSREQSALILTLSNPPANALSLATIDALQKELDRARADTSVRAVVI